MGRKRDENMTESAAECCTVLFICLSRCILEYDLRLRTQVGREKPEQNSLELYQKVLSPFNMNIDRGAKQHFKIRAREEIICSITAQIRY